MVALADPITKTPIPTRIAKVRFSSVPFRCRSSSSLPHSPLKFHSYHPPPHSPPSILRLTWTGAKLIYRTSRLAKSSQKNWYSIIIGEFAAREPHRSSNLEVKQPFLAQKAQRVRPPHAEFSRPMRARKLTWVPKTPRSKEKGEVGGW